MFYQTILFIDSVEVMSHSIIDRNNELLVESHKLA